MEKIEFFIKEMKWKVLLYNINTKERAHEAYRVETLKRPPPIKKCLCLKETYWK